MALHHIGIGASPLGGGISIRRKSLVQQALLAKNMVRKRFESAKQRKPRFETLESRALLAGLPFGADANDTGEFMLGRVAVTPVFLESNGALDASTEDWTPLQKANVLNNIQSGLSWWKQLLATQTSVHTLDFVIDTTFADSPAPTPYEPISRPSNSYVDWVSQFLTDKGFTQSTELEANIRAFNHSQRIKFNTDWSFTIFVVNSQNDADGSFATGGSFTRAFSFAGGLFEVIPSTRPASTYAHETGHMFWARDEYAGGGNYFQRRGYYNAQNTNAIDLNPDSTFVQEDSIMSSGAALDRAFTNIVSPQSMLDQIGWRDSDNDGIFDVLDVPLKLEGFGRLNAAGTEYSFTGSAAVQTLANVNSFGQQNDITLNRVERIEYRINGGNWTTILSPNEYTVNLNLKIPVTANTTGNIEIRAIDTRTGITSNVFAGTLTSTPDMTTVSGIQGLVWNDLNSDGQWQAIESGVPGAKVRLVDTNGQVLVTQSLVEPDDYAVGTVPSSLNATTVDAIGMDTNGQVGIFVDSSATTGTKVFRPFSQSLGAYVDTFHGENQQLRITFARPTTYVSIDAIAAQDGTVARLDAFTSDGKLVERFQTSTLASGSVVKMSVGIDTPTIAYVIARGFRDSRIKLDNLRYGPLNEATVNNNGSFVLPNLPTGSYRVQVVPPSSSYQLVQPSTGLRQASVTAGQATESIDFALNLPVSPWQNQVQRTDVNNDSQVTPLDVLLVINEINRNGARPLQDTGLTPPPFYDVDGNRSIEALDVLIVINFINREQNGNGEGELEAGGSSNSSNVASNSATQTTPTTPTTPEGELPRIAMATLSTGLVLAKPMNVPEYLRTPTLPGCCCPDCLNEHATRAITSIGVVPTIDTNPSVMTADLPPSDTIAGRRSLSGLVDGNALATAVDSTWIDADNFFKQL